MNRQEHLQWAKQRALEYVDLGNLDFAYDSLTSDLGKHEDTAQHAALELGAMLQMGGLLSTERAMREWIKGCS